MQAESVSICGCEERMANNNAEEALAVEGSYCRNLAANPGKKIPLLAIHAKLRYRSNL